MTREGRAEAAASSSPFSLDGKVAIVTGSSRGIGRASAEAMARLGARVGDFKPQGGGVRGGRP